MKFYIYGCAFMIWLKKVNLFRNLREKKYHNKLIKPVRTSEGENLFKIEKA